MDSFKNYIIYYILFIYNFYDPDKILINKFFNFIELLYIFFKFYNNQLYPDYFDIWDNEINRDINNRIDNKELLHINNEHKYEDKYINKVRLMPKEWDINNNELNEMINTIFHELKQNKHKQSLELLNEIRNLENEITHNDTVDDKKLIIYDNIQNLNGEYVELINLINTDNGLNELMMTAKKEANDYFVEQKLDNLMNCFVMETTPIGNVIMNYDKVTETFKYFSDFNVPYRYLEVIARKYVITFNCKPLFIDMEEALKNFEEKWEKYNHYVGEKTLNEINTHNNQTEQNIGNEENNKKNVFVKFKNYNNMTSIKNVQDKNKISSNETIHKNKETEIKRIKENKNRYTYGGKLANFSFLKKINIKIFNKKLGISYADFKKMNNK